MKQSPARNVLSRPPASTMVTEPSTTSINSLFGNGRGFSVAGVPPQTLTNMPCSVSLIHRYPFTTGCSPLSSKSSGGGSRRSSLPCGPLGTRRAMLLGGMAASFCHDDAPVRSSILHCSGKRKSGRPFTTRPDPCEWPAWQRRVDGDTDWEWPPPPQGGNRGRFDGAKSVKNTQKLLGQAQALN